MTAQATQPAKNHGVQRRYGLKGVHQPAQRVVGIAPPETVGAGHIFFTMFVAMVIAPMRRPEHASGVALYQGQPEVRQTIGETSPPHAQMMMVMVDDANAQRQEQQQAVQNPGEAAPPQHDHQHRIGNQVQQALPIARLTQTPRSAHPRASSGRSGKRVPNRRSIKLN